MIIIYLFLFFLKRQMLYILYQFDIYFNKKIYYEEKKSSNSKNINIYLIN